jgi:NAD(P)-dependent dehydrogenase (short-subunit alcohol dehydrogenase family)
MSTKSSINSKVIVVGGSSGIGEATAGQFVALGAEVVIAGRSVAKLKEAAARIGRVDTKVADGTSRESMKMLFESVGAFDHLILALSGGKGAGPFASLVLDDVRSGFEAKLFAQLTVLQAALPYVKSSVTFVSASSAAAAMPGTAGLAAINGAIESMVRPLAAELAPLRVNAVRPGVIDTPWWDGMPQEFKNNVFAQTAQNLPVRRVGQAKDVAEAIVMAALNGFMTGTIIEVSGGATLAR